MVRLLSAISLVIGLAVCETAVASDRGMPTGVGVGQSLRLVAGGWYTHFPRERYGDMQTVGFQLGFTDITATILRRADSAAMDSFPGRDERLSVITIDGGGFGGPSMHGAMFLGNTGRDGGYENGFAAGVTASREFVNDVAGAGNIGIRFANIWRIGFQGFYSHNYLHGSPTETGKFSYSRRTRIVGGMVNVDYDLRIHNALASRLGDEWSPYVGGSVGLAEVTVNSSRPGRTLIDDGAKTLVYQARAGIAYQLNPSVSASLEYRFFDTGRLNFGAVDGGSFEPDYRNHTIEVVVQVEF